MKLNYIIILSIFLISLNFVSAIPPITTVAQFPAGYQLVESVPIPLKVNTDYSYHFFILNSSTGVGINSTGINCSFFLADNQGMNLKAFTPYWNSSKFWSVDIAGGNFSRIGYYKYGLRCSDGVGGALTSYLVVTENGEDIDSDIGITLFGHFFIVALFFALGVTFPKEKWKLKSFFLLCSLLMGLIFFNTVRLVTGVSDGVSSMNELGLILLISVVSFMFLYVLINYTIEVFHYFKDKKEMRWRISSEV